MSHHDDQEANLTHEELKYKEHVQRAAHLAKIDLFLSAREEYKRALLYRPGDEFATGKITECESNIKRDRRKVFIIVPIVIAIIVTVILLA